MYNFFSFLYDMIVLLPLIKKNKLTLATPQKAVKIYTISLKIFAPLDFCKLHLTIHLI
jgi:hypothetical protein